MNLSSIGNFAQGRDGMITIKPHIKKMMTAILIISCLIFSAVLGAIGEPQSTSTSDNDQGPQESSSPRSGSARAAIDVGIESISDIDEENYLDHYPGTVVHMNVTVKNYGTNDVDTPFDILLTISDGSSHPPSYHYQENRTLPHCLNISVLKANTSYNISWNWTPPLKMPDGSEFNFSETDIVFLAKFTTLLDGDEGSNNNQKWIDIEVQQPDFEVELEPGWKIQIGKAWVSFPQEEVVLTIVSGQTNQFQLNFTLHNHGEATFINFSVIGPTDWKAIPPARQFWQSRSNSSSPVPQNLTVTVFPSVQRQYLPTATDLYIYLRAVCESYPLAQAILKFKVKVNFMPLPKIVPPEVEASEVYYATPGDEYINFKVYNKGNGEDNFECEAKVGEGAIGGYFEQIYLDQGWRAIVHSGYITRILRPGEYQIVTVKVTVPATVRAGSPCPITLIATSIKDPDHKDGEKNNTMYIFTDLYRDVSFIKSDIKPISMYPNSETSTIFKIRNTGNKGDKNIRLNVTSMPEGWGVIIDSSDIPAGGLPRNAIAEIEVLIKTPQKVVEAKYDIKIAALSENEVKDEITLNVQVLKVRKIALKSIESKKTGNVSEKISYLITVENLGNAKDSVDLHYSYITLGMEDMAWNVVLSKNFTTLYPYESRDVIVSVFIPLDALADTDFLTPVFNGYFIQIQGISQNDTSVTADKDIEVVVNPIYDFSFSRNTDKKYLILHQTQSMDYTFEITNKGNDIDWYNISYVSDHEWISIPYTQRKLLPGVTEQLFLYFEPPATLDVGVYEFSIRSNSAKKPALKQQLDLEIEIIEFDIAVTEIQIGDVPITTAKVDEGDTVLLRVKIENIGDLDYFVKAFIDDNGNEIPLIIKFTESSNYIGEQNITYLEADKTGQNNSAWVSLAWKIGKARTYDITVEVDPTKDIPESKTSNNKLSGSLKIEGAGEGEDDDQKMSAGDVYLVSSLIIIFIIIMIIGIWMTLRLKKRSVKSGYTEDGEYKPYEETKKTEFEKDEEEEEEPEGGVLGVQDEHPYGKKKDKFLTETMSFDTLKPIRKTKPIRKSKPLISAVGEGKPLGIDKPKIAGYLPPKPKDSTEPEPKPDAQDTDTSESN